MDAGVAGGPIEAPGLVSRRIAAGTRNFAVEPAMTAEQCETALRAGEALRVAVAADTAAFGEMGIGNTSSATLVAHKLTGYGPRLPGRPGGRARRRRSVTEAGHPGTSGAGARRRRSTPVTRYGNTAASRS